MDLLPDPKLDYIQMSEPSAADFLPYMLKTALPFLHARVLVFRQCPASSNSSLLFSWALDLISPLARGLKQPRVITSLKD